MREKGYEMEMNLETIRGGQNVKKNERYPME